MSVEIFKKLSAPFEPSEIEWRVQEARIGEDGKPWAIIIPYVDARAVQERLDSVMGPENWACAYHCEPSGFICSLSLRIGGEWVVKQDGSDHTDIEAFKGGISKALVRAASVWGIGRYLYGTPTTYAEFLNKPEKGSIKAKIGNQYFHWVPPGQGTVPRSDSSPTQEKREGDDRSLQKPGTMPTSPLGETVIPFGNKFKGKRLSDIPIKDLISWVGFMKQKPLNGQAAQVMPLIDKFIAQQTGQNAFPLEEAPF